jgi:hypothetical protein
MFTLEKPAERVTKDPGPLEPLRWTAENAPVCNSELFAAWVTCDCAEGKDKVVKTGGGSSGVFMARGIALVDIGTGVAIGRSTMGGSSHIGESGTGPRASRGRVNVREEA